MNFVYVTDTKWQTFLRAEWDHYPPHSRNELCHVVDPVIHYERSLRTVLARHRALLDEFASVSGAFTTFMQRPSPKTATAEEHAGLSRHGDTTALIHLDVETFYLFAKILLDRIAIALERWFGPVRKASIASHSKLTKNFATYAAAIPLEASSDVGGRLNELRKRVSDFRDYQIAHEQGRNTLRGTKWAAGQEPRIFVAPVESESLETLMEMIDAYIECVTTMIAINRGRSRLLVG